MRTAVSALILYALSICAIAQPAEMDLQPFWLTYSEGAFAPTAAERYADVVYLRLSRAVYGDGELRITSHNPFYIFVNGKLTLAGLTNVQLRTDSLFDAHATRELYVGVYQDNINPRDLKTVWASNRRAVPVEDEGKPGTYFKNFVVISGLLIIVFFVAIFQLNPKLSSDYFSVIKVFSLREVDDAQANARLTSSANVQFYAGTSMLLAFCLLLIFRFLPTDYRAPLHFVGTSLLEAFGDWLQLVLTILAVFLLKILVLFSFTRLFGLVGLARVHYFNWVRALLVLSALAAIILFVIYISHIQSAALFSGALVALVAFVALWIVVLFLKLNGRTDHSMFHLFSYICATEVIPLLIVIKVLFQ